MERGQGRSPGSVPYGTVPKLCLDPAFLPVLTGLAVIVFCNLQTVLRAAKIKSPSPHQ